MTKDVSLGCALQHLKMSCTVLWSYEKVPLAMSEHASQILHVELCVRRLLWGSGFPPVSDRLPMEHMMTAGKRKRARWPTVAVTV